MTYVPVIIAVLGAAVLTAALVRTASPSHVRRWRTARRVRRRLVRHGLSPAQAMCYLRKIDPYVFEELVLLSFRKAGYRIRRNRRYSGDGGVDGRIIKGGRLWLVQCKRYGKYISPSHVAAFAALCEANGCRGVFVHTGRTGPSSKAAAGGVSVVSGGRLLRLIVGGDDILS